MRRYLPAALIFLAIGPAPWTDQRLPRIDKSSQLIVARALAYPAGQEGTLRFVRGWRLTSPNRIFGGFSALAITGPDRFRLVGDGGYGAQLTLHLDGRVEDARIALLPSPSGKARRKSQSDFEAMAFDPASGKIWVALEGLNEVWRIDAKLTHIESRAKLPKPYWPANRGPEAMVRLADGRTLILSEDADDDPRGRAAWLFAGDPAVPGTKAVRFFYDSQGKGLVSDAAALPDGRILLVHRKLGLNPVFTTTLAIADPADIRPGAAIRSRPIGRVPVPLAENYEGAAVEVRGGRTFLWLASDDNFNSWQRSLLVEFELVDLPDSKKAAR
ncbi:esterase-like activity of phytase family protein [Sphingopyxis sp. BSN-002]|uniref:esterase-like activity of phytase family protein n=1 Tax=Sphingopyxis sp. BSN-002 TaxID=2911495 RepID=UPI001EDB6814|nr:esterase-like activity of phytase family protein [Sphingopyxis sp. BSN-002]UKK82787.1 esterase-like activity of phytase family protein [Sphingopyxis sp. BSN-002]